MGTSQREQGFFENYKDKLKKYNATDLYRQEMDFMIDLMKPKGNLLDYGCGTGYMMRYIMDKCKCRVYGYDKYDFYEGNPFYYRGDYYFGFDCVYFMHSLAHIDDPEEKIMGLRGHAKSICVITPNLDWLDKGYAGDSTVVKHFTLQSLKKLFENWTIEKIGQFGTPKGKQKERLFIKVK